MSVISNTERALSIASEHVAWAQRQSIKPEAVLRSIGHRRRRRDAPRTWPEVIDALVVAWMRL